MGTKTATRTRKPPAKKSLARVLIVDDHPLIRHALAQLLAREPGLEVCGEVPDAAGAWHELERRQPELMIVDLRLEDSDGLDLIKAIRSRYPTVRILVVSMHDEKEYAERALRAGAAGYVEKHEPPEVVLEAVRHVLGGAVFLSRRMGERLLRQLVERPGRGGPPASRLASLSDRELQVLDLLGQGLSTPEIARRLRLSAKTIQSHREHLKAKLGIESGSELVYYAIARQFSGSTIEPPEPPQEPATKPTLRVTR
jgi:DNA-binding NarL/FixJ family response regulator